MKKAFAVFLFCFLFFGAAQAQRFGWGINGGLSMSTVNGTWPLGGDISNAELVPGFFIGTYVKYRPRRFFSMSSGFNYISKGANLDNNPGETGFGQPTGQLRSIYFEIPVLVQLNFSPYTPNRPNLFIGPSFAWAVSVRDDFTIDYYGGGVPPMVDVAAQYYKFDPGLIIGGGIDIDISDWKMFTAGVRYTHSFRNIIDAESSDFDRSPDYQMKNLNVTFFLGLTWVIPTYTLNSPDKRNKREKYKPINPKKYKG